MTDRETTALFTQSISEWEIDWIMAMELNGNVEFRAWLGEQLFEFPPVHDGAWKSVVEDAGESDLVWRVKDQTGKFHMALIENKINAAEQPDQCARYSTRGDEYVAGGHTVDYCTVLIAPQDYWSPESDDYDIRVSYEMVRDYFQADTTERGQYLAGILQQAILKLPTGCPDVTAFRRRVWGIAKEQFSHLQIRQPKPTSEPWVSEQHSGYYVVYKPVKRINGDNRAVVDIQLPKRGDDVEALTNQFGEQLKQFGAIVEAASQSAVIRIVLPNAHETTTVTDEEIHTALEAWDTLLSWSRTADLGHSISTCGRPEPDDGGRPDVSV